MCILHASGRDGKMRAFPSLGFAQSGYFYKVLRMSPLHGRLFATIVPLALLVAGSHAADSASTITSVERSPGGVLKLTLKLPESRYAVVQRSQSLAGPWKPVAIVRGAADPVVTRDNAPLGDTGFMRAILHDVTSPVDTDGDGIDDIAELDSPGTLNPLNSAPAIAAVNGATQIPDRASYESLSHRDNFPGAQNIREVKFVIFGVDTDSPELYFVDSNTHTYHFRFAVAVGRYSNNSSFSADTYFTNINRKNLAGSIVAHDNYLDPEGRQGIYTVEFWPTDPVAFRFVEKAFSLITAGMPFLDGNIAYHPASETQRGVLQSEAAQYAQTNIRTIFAEELFGNVTYSALNPGECFGRLRYITGTETLSVRDVAILRTIPNDLTHVAGIITETQQTPLSHINLKAKQNGTPNAFLLEASSHPEIAPLLGENVYLKIGPDGFEIRSATQIEVDTYFDTIRPDTPQTPIRDLSQTTIEPLSEIGFEDAPAFGSKSANVGELQDFLPAVTPDGFAVPFYFYDEFMKFNGFYAEAEAMMADATFQTDPATREAALEAFRKRIAKYGVVPYWMSTALGDIQETFPASLSIRFRSSTNNEDLEGFNGAGLYDSYSHHPNEGHFVKSAKQVWAGLWTYRAFEEREFWRIDHATAAMGILIHPNYSAEVANGVGVTKNPYLPGAGWDGHYMNVQVGENLITNPEPGSLPDEFTIANLSGGGGFEIQYIRHSNLIPDGETVMTRDQALALRGHMASLHSRFKSLYNGDSNFAMEIEFKITAAGEIVIKQARPWVD
jgi:pyruvate,water dikinase